MILDRRSLMAAMGAVPAVSLPVLARTRTDDASVEAALDSVFERYAPVGLGAALVSREGLVASGVRGLRRKDGTEPVLTTDAWHLGSNTKAMTAVLFARLVEQGLADWDLKLVDALPCEHDPAWADVRVVELMQHRAGLRDEDVLGQAWFMTARGDPATLPEQRLAVAKKALASAPGGTPGQFQYGNANYMVAAAAMEVITGQDWQALMVEQVFGPLGITSAGFGAPREPASWGHLEQSGRMVSLPPSHPGSDNPAALGPAGTVHMTLEDYGRFLAVFLNDGLPLLQPESVARLSQPAEGPPPAYGCGWIVLNQPWASADGTTPGRVLAHDGSNTIWYATAAVAPARNLALIAVSNDGKAGAQACPALLRALIAGLPVADSAPVV
ncbi:MAG: serine hydrolase domain-containing protein [Brevundimonas sp.]|uniref:serine hydrolase domain-containing protein n=1 Tax=Brevundimonas sp. TaxID=1871086 RepID=UPI002732881B|nr:serine hydrolase domain-containing protein [Brevundimonas sp.]MDP3379645.1 serine hydrolase domain-containing protein [Brevundimonas sp.]